jgi:cytochrome P450
VKNKARTVVDRAIEKFGDSEFDFVDNIAAPFPLQIICEMMGIPESDERQILDWTNVILGAGDPDFGGTLENLITVALEIFAYAQALGEARLKNPTDDLTSVMMHSIVDGDRMSSQEFGSFFILLVVAGNETTRNAISHGMRQLSLQPDERAKWFNNFDANTKTAVEEIVRWASPVIHFRRTATRDTEIRGVKIKEGEKIVMWYNSANRDEDVYADPYTFDVTRTAAPAQVGFGAGGHECCGGGNIPAETNNSFQVMQRHAELGLPFMANFDGGTVVLNRERSPVASVANVAFNLFDADALGHADSPFVWMAGCVGGCLVGVCGGWRAAASDSM